MNLRDIHEIGQKLVSKFVVFGWPFVIEFDEQNFQFPDMGLFGVEKFYNSQCAEEV